MVSFLDTTAPDQFVEAEWSLYSPADSLGSACNARNIKMRSRLVAQLPNIHWAEFAVRRATIEGETSGSVTLYDEVCYYSCVPVRRHYEPKKRFFVWEGSEQLHDNIVGCKVGRYGIRHKQAVAIAHQKYGSGEDVEFVRCKKEEATYSVQEFEKVMGWGMIPKGKVVRFRPK